MLGGLIMVFFTATANLPLPLAFILTVAAVTVVGALMERFTIYPLKNGTVLTMIIVTIAVSILFKGIAMFVITSYSIHYTKLYEFGKPGPLRLESLVLLCSPSLL